MPRLFKWCKTSSILSRAFSCSSASCVRACASHSAPRHPLISFQQSLPYGPMFKTIAKEGSKSKVSSQSRHRLCATCRLPCLIVALPERVSESGKGSSIPLFHPMSLSIEAQLWVSPRGRAVHSAGPVLASCVSEPGIQPHSHAG